MESRRKEGVRLFADRGLRLDPSEDWLCHSASPTWLGSACGAMARNTTLGQAYRAKGFQTEVSEETVQ